MLKNKKKIIVLIITIAIILAGAVIYFTLGFNHSLESGKNKKIEISLGFNFDESKMQEILKDTFDDYLLQIGNDTNDTAIITVKDISDEQKTALIEKVNEKYELELTEDDITEKTTGNIDIKTVVSQYWFILLISTLLIEGYLLIRFRKLGILKILAVSLGEVILSQIIAISLILILRVELDYAVMPVLLTIFTIDYFIITCIFETKMSKKKEK